MAHASLILGGSRPNQAHAIGGMGRRLKRYIAHFFAGLEVARQRRRLLALDDRALKDIGISRADAHAEAGRGFWDIPDDMKRSL